MSLQILSQINAWRHPHLYDEDAAVPIGSELARTRPTLTEIVPGGGVLRYGAEVGDIQVWRDRPIRLELPEANASGIVAIQTIEIETKNKCLLGKTIVLAYRPISCDWFGTAKVKSVNRTSRKERTSFIGNALREAAKPATLSGFMSEVQIWRMIDGLPQDPFGHEDRYYARFHGYDQLDTIGIETDWSTTDLPSQYQNGQPNRSPHREPLIAYGVVSDLDQCLSFLEKSDLLQEVIGQIDGASMKDHQHSPSIHIPGGGRVPVNGDTAALARNAWRAAMIKSLAGPDDEQKRKLQRFDKWTKEFGDVAVVAKWIYEDTMVNLTKRLKGERIHVNREKRNA